VKRTLQKQAYNKIKDPTLCSNVLQELGNTMYDRDGPFGANVEMWAMIKLHKHPIANLFCKYMEENW
jgi:hypothetical protein